MNQVKTIVQLGPKIKCFHHFNQGKPFELSGEAKKAISSSHPHVVDLITKADETSSLPYIDAVTSFGKSCSMPHSFQVSDLFLKEEGFVLTRQNPSNNGIPILI